MVKAVLGIYDYFRRRRWLCACLLAGIAGLLVVSGLSLGYKEDISDFMPMDDRDRRGMEIYQGISGGNRILVLFEAADTSAGVDRYALMEAVDAFSDEPYGRADVADRRIADGRVDGLVLQ